LKFTSEIQKFRTRNPAIQGMDFCVKNALKLIYEHLGYPPPYRRGKKRREGEGKGVGGEGTKGKGKEGRRGREAGQEEREGRAGGRGGEGKGRGWEGRGKVGWGDRPCSPHFFKPGDAPGRMTV
jgi:hypothetical protein